jgi:hypothetical protein
MWVRLDVVTLPCSDMVSGSWRFFSAVMMVTVFTDDGEIGDIADDGDIVPGEKANQLGVVGDSDSATIVLSSPPELSLMRAKATLPYPRSNSPFSRSFSMYVSVVSSIRIFGGRA